MEGFLSGEKHWNWKDGRSKKIIYKRFYKIRKDLLKYGKIEFEIIQKIYEEY